MVANLPEAGENLPETGENPLKTCRKCGIPQPLDRFPFRKAEQTYRGTCKTCRAAESHALRQHPDHADRIRDAERQRNHRRRPAIKQWQREHRANMRPGWRRRAARWRVRQKAAAHATQQPPPPAT